MPIYYCNQHARLFNQHKSLWMDFGREKMRRAEAVYNYVGTAAFKIVETRCDLCTTMVRQAVYEQIEPPQ